MKIPYAYLLLGPSALYVLGFALNALVMVVNGNLMPVFVGGGCTQEVFGEHDFVHTCMTHATHLKVIADWIVINHLGIASPGDLGMWSCEAAFWPALTAWVALMIHRKDK